MITDQKDRNNKKKDRISLRNTKYNRHGIQNAANMTRNVMTKRMYVRTIGKQVIKLEVELFGKSCWNLIDQRADFLDIWWGRIYNEGTSPQ